MRNCCSLFLPPFPFLIPANASPKYHSLSLVETMQTTHWPIQCHLTPCHSSLTSSIPFLSQSSTAAGQALRAAWEPFNDFGQLDDTAHSETSNKDIHTHTHTCRERRWHNHNELIRLEHRVATYGCKRQKHSRCHGNKLLCVQSAARGSLNSS